MTEEGTPIPPTVDSIVAEINRENMKWEAALGDLIDNSLDAGATRVLITITTRGKKSRVDVRDNGDGCAEPHRMLQQGYSTKKGKRGMVGRYGVGLKHASFYVCGMEGTTTITTKAGGSTRMATVRWGDVVRSGQWRIPPVVTLQDSDAAIALLDGRGTTVEFDGDRRWLSSDDTKKLLERFGFVFSPALRQGRQIEFVINGKRHPLAPPKDPVWAESLQFEAVVGSRKALVRAGIKSPTDTSGRCGMSYSYGHRVIIQDESDGLGPYSRNGFAGLVELDEHWDLGQNKLSVTDSHWQDLCEKIEEQLRPMLEKLRSQSMLVQFESLKNSASMMLGQLVDEGHRWNVRGDGTRVGPFPKGGGGRPRPGAGVAPQKNVKRQAMRVDFYEDDEDSRGGFVEGNGYVVQLNLSCARVRRARDEGDDEWLAEAAAYFVFQQRSERMLPGQRAQPFQDAVGALWRNAVKVQKAATA